MERRRRKLRAAGEWAAMEMEVARLGAGVLDGGRIRGLVGKWTVKRRRNIRVLGSG